MKWCYDKRYFDGVIEVFEVSRSYKELRDRMNNERVDDYIEFLPGDVVSAARGVNNVDDLPIYKMGLLVIDDYYTKEIIKDLIITDNTKGELTIPNVDRIFKLIV